MPAGNGLTTLIALIGHCCACADAAVAIRIASAAARHRARMDLSSNVSGMVVLPQSLVCFSAKIGDVQSRNNRLIRSHSATSRMVDLTADTQKKKARFPAGGGAEGEQGHSRKGRDPRHVDIQVSHRKRHPSARSPTRHPGGMPRMMSVGEYEYIIEPETTYIPSVARTTTVVSSPMGRPWP